MQLPLRRSKFPLAALRPTRLEGPSNSRLHCDAFARWRFGQRSADGLAAPFSQGSGSHWFYRACSIRCQVVAVRNGQNRRGNPAGGTPSHKAPLWLLVPSSPCVIPTNVMCWCCPIEEGPQIEAGQPSLGTWSASQAQGEDRVDKKQAVLSALQGQHMGAVPAAFWYHFPAEHAHGGAAVDAHKRYFRATDVDIMKVMNENLHPVVLSVESSSDWKRFRPMSMTSRQVRDQIDILKRLVDSVGGDAVTLCTIHGVVASASHAIGRTYEDAPEFLSEQARMNPDALALVFESLAEVLTSFAMMVVDAGADGVFYAAFGGERDTFTDNEFLAQISEWDKQVLTAARSSGMITALHICKDGLNLERYTDYPADIVNWAARGGNPTLKEARELFPRTVILGGIDNSNERLRRDSESTCAALAQAALESMAEDPRYILGADCSLASDTPMRNIEAMTRVAHRFVGSAAQGPARTG